VRTGKQSPAKTSAPQFSEGSSETAFVCLFCKRAGPSSDSQKLVFARLWRLKCGTALFAAEKLLSHRSRIKCKQEPWEASPSLTA